ncbi:hypothetical protein [Virgibacillus doumboii]|uniref:hypothetical protein n=1 Tax=Virgibacillus doumboii TaxID=2697503 RepID=UPI0013E0DB24|nr:hypothetical protein [Virgibacillus doumboii]
MKKFFALLSLLILILAGCNAQKNDDNYFLSLTGESDSWKLNRYEIVITPEEFKLGNGTLTMKNHEEYKTDSFHFTTHAVINNEDRTIHTSSVTGMGIDIAEETTGTIEGKGENSITLDDISDVYMIVEWWDVNKEENVKERINLYNKPEGNDTFLK